MTSGIKNLIVAAAMVAATPSLAGAQMVAYGTSSPVELVSFSVDESYGLATPSGAAKEPTRFTGMLDSGNVAIKFINMSNVPATSVRFLVKAGNRTQLIVDKGSFSQGVQVKHSFAVVNENGELSNATCNVAEVDFADGSAWNFARESVEHQ